MDKLLNIPKVNDTVCVGSACGAAALKEAGLTSEQDNINSVNTSLIVNLLIGSACMFGFLFLRTFMKTYQLRCYLPSITVKPPPIPGGGMLSKFFGWLVPVFTKSDAYILRAAGLDALVLQKVHAVGLQICIPIAIVGCCLVLPLQMHEGYIRGDSSYGRLTAANIRPRSNVMWAHCVMLFVMLGWVFTLLEFHTREYATVRQHYLKGSDDPNYWRDLHMAEADGTLVHKQSKLLAVVGEMQHEQELEQLLQELDETVGKRTWWRRFMISLTSWTGQEGAEGASLLSNAVHRLKSKKRSKSMKRAGGDAGGDITRLEETPSGALHIDLARDIVQGDFERDAKLRKAASGSMSPSQTPSPAPDGAAAAAGTASIAASPGTGTGSAAPAAAAAAAAAEGEAAAGVRGGSNSTLRSLASMPAARAGGGGGTVMTFSPDEATVESPFEAPPACCDLEAENINNIVAHKWWTQVEHVATADGRLRRLTEEEQEAEEIKQVMLAKPSVRYRKTINALDGRGRRTAVHAQQYAVLVTNVNQPCYPEYYMVEGDGAKKAKKDARAAPPGAGTCGNLPKGTYPAWVKYELEGPLKGHAEESEQQRHQHPARLTSSKSFDATRSSRMMAPGPYGEDNSPCAAGAAVAVTRTSANGRDKEGAGKDAGDVEQGLHSPTTCHDHSHAAHHHHPPFHRNPYHKAIATPATAAAAAAGGAGSGRDGSDGGSGSGSPPGPVNSSVRQRSGKELWALVRQFKADKKTPGRSLYLLARDQHYSIVAHIFSQLFPDDFDRVVPVFNFRRVDLLMRRWDVRLGQLEAAQYTLQRTGKRPTRKSMCCGGQQVDAIDWLQQDIRRLEATILDERDAALVYAQTPSWFVLFRSQKAAAIASSCNILPMNQDLFQVHPAPGPEEVNWEALWFNHGQRALRSLITTPFAILVVFAPVSGLTSAISSLSGSFCQAVKWEFYCSTRSGMGRILKGLVTGFLPSLLIILWQGLCLPRLVYLVAQSEGRHYSLSAVDRRMGELYFFWDIFNMFLQGVLGSAAVNAATGSIDALKKGGELFNAPQEVPRIIGEALPASSKFFFTYVIMRTFMSVPLRFLITQPGVWQSWLRYLVRVFVAMGGGKFQKEHVPPRALFMRYAIRSPRYGVEYGSTLLILLIALAFALISPLIVLFGAAFCGGMWVFWRYQLMYNYQRKYESGGLMWQFFVNRVLVCCSIMVAFTGCVLIIKQGFVQAAIIWLFGIVGTIAFANHLNRKYMNAIAEMPLYLANKAPRARVPSSIYVPPPLQANGLGWYPEFNKCWEWFGMPGYSW